MTFLVINSLTMEPNTHLPSNPSLSIPNILRERKFSPSMIRLNLFKVRVTDERLKEMLHFLTNTSNVIEKLILNGELLSDDGMSLLCASLSHPNLHITNLSIGALLWRGIGPAFSSKVKIIGEMLRTNTTLLTLHLTSHVIGNTGAKFLAGGMRFNTTLKTLDLCEGKIGREGGKLLCKSLVNKSSLTALNLSRNIIGDGAGKIVSRILLTCPLVSLQLFGCMLGRKTIEEICEVVKGKTSLVSLDIRCNSVPSKRGIAGVFQNEYILFWRLTGFSQTEANRLTRRNKEFWRVLIKWSFILNFLCRIMVAEWKRIPMEMIELILRNILPPKVLKAHEMRRIVDFSSSLKTLGKMDKANFLEEIFGRGGRIALKMRI